MFSYNCFIAESSYLKRLRESVKCSVFNYEWLHLKENGIGSDHYPAGATGLKDVLRITVTS